MSRRLILACVISASLTSAGQGQRGRVWMADDLLEVGRVTDTRGDRLANPQRMARCGNLLAVLDLEDAHVTAVSLDNRILWRAGRSGSGPGEFRTLGSISCDGTGQLWIPDRGNARLQRITAAGVFAPSIPVDQGIRRLAVAAGDSILWALTPAGTELALLLDRMGKTRRSVELPGWLRPLNSLQRESMIAPTRDGGLIVAFRWSSTLVRISPAGIVDSMGRGIEPIPFPEFRAFPSGQAGETILRIDPAAPEAAQSLSVNGDTITVLFAGRSGNKGRILDRYLTNGRYIGSVLLPVTPLDVVMAGERIFVLLSEPEPAVVALARRPRRPSR